MRYNDDELAVIKGSFAENEDLILALRKAFLQAELTQEEEKQVLAIAAEDADYAKFHFTSYDNPHVDPAEIDKAKDEVAYDTFKQEYLAEYIDFQGALFNYGALVDVFTNTVNRSADKYLVVDIADDGSDKTIFSFWEGLVEYKRQGYERLNTEQIIEKIREFAATDRIPYSNIVVDAIGVGTGVAKSSMLDGIIGYKSSYSPIKTDQDIVTLPNVGVVPGAKFTSDYRNLRCQCLFVLSQHVNNHKIASEIDGQSKENTIEELSLYQDISKGDTKRMATPKEDVKDMLGRSPDDSDTWIMRMYFEIRSEMSPRQSEENAMIKNNLSNRFQMNRNRVGANNAR